MRLVDGDIVRVLLIDDDEDDYVLTQHLFEDFKGLEYELEWTTNGNKALNSMIASEYDIYLIDYHLGEYSGLEILRRAIAKGCTSPIVLLTGQGDKEVDLEAMQAGAADYLVKGQFEAPLLERVIRYSLQHARSLEKMQVSETRFRSVIQSASDAIFLVNDQGNVILWNKAAEGIFGYDEDEIVGQSATKLMGKKYASKAIKLGFTKMVEDVLLPKSGKTIEALGRRKNGKEFSLEMSGSTWETNEGSYYTAIIRDITDRQKAEEERDRLYNLSNDLLATIGFDGNLLHLNPAWKNILGYENKEILGNSLMELIHPADRENSLVETRKLKTGENVSFESRLIRRDGSSRWILWNSTPMVSEEIFYAVGRDITERKHAEELLLYSASTDMLTNLPNRTRFMDHLRNAIREYEKNPKGRFAVLFLDLDRFKIINDGLGHFIGDKLLVAIAERLKAVVRPGDIVARLGGDEFTLLVKNVNKVRDVTNVAERIQANLSKPFRLDSYEVFSSASIGIIIADESKRKPEDFLRDADSAMYRAKETGKARYEVFDRKMHIQNQNLIQLETDLRKAIKREEFLVYYQPIVSLNNWEIREMEALVRWRHPEYGIVAPNEFIAVAEETGLIIDIGEWVLKESCWQTRAWQKEFSHLSEIPVSVNLSTKQLMHPNLTSRVPDVLKETDFDFSSLRLEITESTVMENAETALNVMNELASLGASFSIDDFGTSYSSLSYLHRFPFKRIKLDRDFIAKMDSDMKVEAMIRTILLLGEDLELEVVAEGIETHGQWEKLVELGCKLGQGYLFSKPANATYSGKLLESGLRSEMLKKGMPQINIDSNKVIEVHKPQ